MGLILLKARPAVLTDSAPVAKSWWGLEGPRGANSCRKEGFQLVHQEQPLPSQSQSGKVRKESDIRLLWEALNICQMWFAEGGSDPAPPPPLWLPLRVCNMNCNCNPRIPKWQNSDFSPLIYSNRNSPSGTIRGNLTHKTSAQKLMLQRTTTVIWMQGVCVWGGSILFTRHICGRNKPR